MAREVPTRYRARTQVKYLAGTGSQYTESFGYKTWSFHELGASTDPRGKVSGQPANERHPAQRGDGGVRIR